jgi:RND superfamily putative drug exporter
MLSRAVGYGLTELGITVNGQSSSILSVLVLGAGTDYALLLVARYREELRKHEDRHEALALALKTAGPAIVASGMTVVAAMLCLTLAELNGTSGLGPIAAMAILVAMLSMLTLLPALLVICGRRAFWPFVPHHGDEGSDATHGFWRRVAERVSARPRGVWVGAALVLLVFAAGTLNFSDGLTSGNQYRDQVE